MIEKIGIFILFLGPLVFFHELGHFLFARFFGVRVEVFSIGFGPKILKFKKGDTEYALSLIPLGGYVKMFGDDPLRKNEIEESQRRYSFTFKNKWERFWIVMGGPLANFILAYIIFWGLFFVGERVPEVKVGEVREESSFYRHGFRTGDIISRVNDNIVHGPTDVVLSGKNFIDTMTVKRGEREYTLPIQMDSDEFLKEFVNHPPILRLPLVSDANGQQFFILPSSNPMQQIRSVEEMFYGENLPINNLYRFSVDRSSGGKPRPKALIEQYEIPIKDITAFNEFLKASQLRTIDLIVRNVVAKSPAESAGIKKGDILLSLNGAELFSFESLRKSLQKTNPGNVEVTFWRKGEINKVKVVPTVKEVEDKKVKSLGVYSGGEYLALKRYQTGSRGIWGSTTSAFTRSIDSTAKIIHSFKKLIVGEASMKNIGGPVAIAKVASDSFDTSITNFLKLMALISIHLGIINLFPIPVLDGGHILFIFVELLNKGPLSRKKMEIAQQFGLSLLLMLMVGAIYNDVSNFF